MAAQILVVEDEGSLSDLYRTILTEAGYEVFTSADGEEALELIKSNKYDLVLLDLLLPGIKGVDILISLAKDKLLKSRKIVVLSNAGDQEIKEQVMDIGACDFIVKSDLTPGQIVNKVKKLLI